MPGEFDNVIVMSSNRFQKICRNIHNFSERIEIECVGSELCFRGCNTNVKQECKIKPTENGMKFIQNDNPNDIIPFLPLFHWEVWKVLMHTDL